MVLLQLADFGGGESLVAGQEAVAAQRSGSTVTEEPVVPDELDLVVFVTSLHAVDTDGIVF